MRMKHYLHMAGAVNLDCQIERGFVHGKRQAQKDQPRIRSSAPISRLAHTWDENTRNLIFWMGNVQIQPLANHNHFSGQPCALPDI